MNGRLSRGSGFGSIGFHGAFTKSGRTAVGSRFFDDIIFARRYDGEIY